MKRKRRHTVLTVLCMFFIANIISGYAQENIKVSISSGYTTGKKKFENFDSPSESLVSSDDSLIYMLRKGEKNTAADLYVCTYSKKDGEYVNMRLFLSDTKDPALMYSGVNSDMKMVIFEKFDASDGVKTIFYQKVNEKLEAEGNLQPLVKIKQDKEKRGIPLFTKGVFVPDIFFHYLPVTKNIIDTGAFICYILDEALILKDSFHYTLPPGVRFNYPVSNWMRSYEFGFYFFAKEKPKRNRSEYKFYYVNTGSKLVEVIRSDNPVGLTSPVLYTENGFAGIVDHTIGWGSDTADIRFIKAKNESLWIWDLVEVILDPAYRNNMVNNSMVKEPVKEKMAPVVTQDIFRTSVGNMFVVGIQTPFYPATDTITKTKEPVCHYGTVIVTFLDSMGKELWTRCIENVPVEEEEAHTGIRCFMKNDKLELFYFDHITNTVADSVKSALPLPADNASELVLVNIELDKDGIMKSGPVLKNDRMNLNMSLPELIYIHNEPVLIRFYQDKKNGERMLYIR